VGGQVNVTGKIEYGEFGSGIQNFISNGGKLNCYADYIISGSASRHIYMDGSGGFFQAVGNTVTVKRSPAFSAAFCSVGNYGQLTAYGQTYSYPAITCTIASPGVITYAGHGMSANAPVAFATTGALPTGITAGTTYYIKTVIDANTFTISATPGGTAINTSGSQSGTHTLIATGPRYSTANLGTIETAGGGTTYFPGNAAGSGTNPATSPYGYYR
jgi:hypothetical protein